MFLLISRNYKPDFEMMVEGIFSTHKQAMEFKEQCEEWKHNETWAAHNDEYYIIEMPLNPYPYSEQHYYNIEFHAPNGPFNVIPISYDSPHWIQPPFHELNKVRQFKNSTVNRFNVVVIAKNAAKASTIGAPLIKEAWWSRR